MSEFKDVAHKTVAELFDMLKGKLAEVDSLKAQLDNMEQCYIQKKKQVDDCAALAKEWRTLAREMCPLDDKYVIGARLGCAQDIEEVLRGEHETK